MLDGRSFCDMSHADMLADVDGTVKACFSSEPEVYRAQRGALFPPNTAEASGRHHLPWALPKVLYAVKEIKRLAGSTRGGGCRTVRYFHRKRNPILISATISQGTNLVPCVISSTPPASSAPR